MEDSDSTKQPENKILFGMKTDFENAKIHDYRDPADPINRLVLTCAHASNALPEGYSWSENDQKYFANEHWAWDPAALKTAVDLASRLKVSLLHSLYTRLIADVNRDVTENDVFRRSGDGREVELNHDLTEEEEVKRVIIYHASYYHALKELSEKVKPDFVVAIHTFTPLYEGKKRTLEIGVNFDKSDELGQRLYEGIKEKGYNVEMNQPYSGKGNTGHAMHSILNYDEKKERQGVYLEFRNDVLQDPERVDKIRIDIAEVLTNVILRDGTTKNTK